MNDNNTHNQLRFVFTYDEAFSFSKLIENELDHVDVPIIGGDRNEPDMLADSQSKAIYLETKSKMEIPVHVTNRDSIPSRIDQLCGYSWMLYMIKRRPVDCLSYMDNFIKKEHNTKSIIVDVKQRCSLCEHVQFLFYLFHFYRSIQKTQLIDYNQHVTRPPTEKIRVLQQNFVPLYVDELGQSGLCSNSMFFFLVSRLTVVSAMVINTAASMLDRQDTTDKMLATAEINLNITLSILQAVKSLYVSEQAARKESANFEDNKRFVFEKTNSNISSPNTTSGYFHYSMHTSTGYADDSKTPTPDVYELTSKPFLLKIDQSIEMARILIAYIRYVMCSRKGYHRVGEAMCYIYIALNGASKLDFPNQDKIDGANNASVLSTVVSHVAQMVIGSNHTIRRGDLFDIKSRSFEIRFSETNKPPRGEEEEEDYVFWFSKNALVCPISNVTLYHNEREQKRAVTKKILPPVVKTTVVTPDPIKQNQHDVETQQQQALTTDVITTTGVNDRTQIRGDSVTKQQGVDSVNSNTNLSSSPQLYHSIKDGSAIMPKKPLAPYYYLWFERLLYDLFRVSSLYCVSIDLYNMAMMFSASSKGYAPMEMDVTAYREYNALQSTAKLMNPLLSKRVKQNKYFHRIEEEISHQTNVECWSMDYLKRNIDIEEIATVLNNREIEFGKSFDLISSSPYTAFRFK